MSMKPARIPPSPDLQTFTYPSELNTSGMVVAIHEKDGDMIAILRETPNSDFYAHRFAASCKAIDALVLSRLALWNAWKDAIDQDEFDAHPLIQMIDATFKVAKVSQ